MESSISNSGFTTTVNGELSKLEGRTATILLVAVSGKESLLKLAKLGHTNAADAGMDIWTNFGVVISVKNYELNLELLKKVLTDTPVGELVIVCESFSLAAKAEIEQVSESRSITLITKADLIFDAGQLLGDESRAEKFNFTFKESFDHEFPSTATLNGFMTRRGYSLSAPISVNW